MISFGFTRSEKMVVLFLFGFLSLGATIRLYKTLNAFPETRLTAKSQMDSLRQEFLKQSQAIPLKEPIKAQSRAKKTEEKITRPININIATLQELTLLPKIGPGLAKRIIEYREEKGGFKQASDILKVKGIGPKKFAEIQALIIVQ